MASRRLRRLLTNVRVASSALVLLALCAGSAYAQGSGTLSVSINSAAYDAGQTMVVTATVSPPSNAGPVDAYIVVQLPTGQFFSLQLDGRLVPGVVPIARGFVPFAYRAVVVSYRFSGVEPVGTYKWYSVLTGPGTLDFVTPLQQTVFTFPALSAINTRAELSRALVTADFASADPYLGVALKGIVQEISSSDLGDISRALTTCVVVEQTALYEVCATADDEFRFVQLRDSRNVWRVIVW